MKKHKIKIKTENRSKNRNGFERCFKTKTEQILMIFLFIMKKHYINLKESRKLQLIPRYIPYAVKAFDRLPLNLLLDCRLLQALTKFCV